LTSIAALSLDKAVLATDLPIELAHAPATTQRLGLVELAGMLIFDRQQPDIGRPRQGEDLGQFREVEFPRHRLGFLSRRPISQFPRQCLGNCLKGVSNKEAPHVLQIVRAEAATESNRQVGGQPLHQLIAVTGPPPAFLLGFDNPAANLPIAGRHQGIDAARRCLARRIQQFHDAAVDAGIASRQGCVPPHCRRRFPCHAVTSIERNAPAIASRRFATSSAASRTGVSSV